MEGTGKIDFGSVVATPKVVKRIKSDVVFAIFIGICIGRYVNFDWGDTCLEDIALNDKAIVSGGRLFAVYKYSSNRSVWLITEADRSTTTILFPDEY